MCVQSSGTVYQMLDNVRIHWNRPQKQRRAGFEYIASVTLNNKCKSFDSQPFTANFDAAQTKASGEHKHFLVFVQRIEDPRYWWWISACLCQDNNAEYKWHIFLGAVCSDIFCIAL